MTHRAHCEERADGLAEALAERGAKDCRLALVLGSGLGDFAKSLEDAETILGHELADLPGSAVPGHAGRIVIGTCEGERVLVQQGRVHLYEGWSGWEVTRAVRAFARLGIGRLVLTNAAGGIRSEIEPPALLRITDHLDLQGSAPLYPAERGQRSPYDPGLGEALERAAHSVGVPLYRGVYAGLLGPSYETPAEIAMLARLGADAVGMSTVAEASAAAAAGMRVCAISCISNAAASHERDPLSHAEVVAAGKLVAKSFVRLLRRAVPELVHA